MFLGGGGRGSEPPPPSRLRSGKLRRFRSLIPGAENAGKALERLRARLTSDLLLLTETSATRLTYIETLVLNNSRVVGTLTLANDFPPLDLTGDIWIVTGARGTARAHLRCKPVKAAHHAYSSASGKPYSQDVLRTGGKGRKAHRWFRVRRKDARWHALGFAP